MSNSVKVLGGIDDSYRESLLTPEALNFIGYLHRMFNGERKSLLEARSKRQEQISRGVMPDFDPETKIIRAGSWQVAAAPSDLNDRRVEITGPTDRKMMINALNSGAKVFMADLEDALSPSWKNILEGQLNLKRAVRRQIDFVAENGKSYKLNDTIATLLVRPRGWHLIDSHIQVDGENISASLMDFGLYIFHNGKTLIENGSGPYFYLPKLEHYSEARLWNRVFTEAQAYLGIPYGTIRATVLIETILAAFQMEEILYELKDHSSGLNAGRWDYIFSYIKRFRDNPNFVLPDRAQITMIVPFMRAYTELLVKSCHTHGAHAIGGMSAFIPNRKLPEVTEQAVSAVKSDKDREAKDGFDGTWVAHPDLVSVAKSAFDKVLGKEPHQKHVKRPDVQVEAKDLLTSGLNKGVISEAGVRENLSVALQYIEKWLHGLGAVAINNLMEDAATAEISRAQLWQWMNHKVTLDDGRAFSKGLYMQIKEDELKRIGGECQGYLKEASQILDNLVLDQEFTEFLTIPAYQVLTEKNHSMSQN